MADLKIKVRDGVYLSGIRETDAPTLLEHLHSKDVYNTTMNIPHPYLETDADWWIDKRIAHTRDLGKEVTFAIRDDAAKLIGVVGADSLRAGFYPQGGDRLLVGPGVLGTGDHDGCRENLCRLCVR